MTLPDNIELVIQDTTEYIVDLQQETINIDIQGGQGPAGIPGEYIYLEVPFTFQSSVTVNHGFGKKVTVVAIDSAGTVIHGNTSYDSNDVVTWSCANPFTGKLILK